MSNDIDDKLGMFHKNLSGEWENKLIILNEPTCSAFESVPCLCLWEMFPYEVAP